MISELQNSNEEIVNKVSKIFNIDVKNDLLNNTFSHYLLFIDKDIIGYLNYYLIYDRIEIANFFVLESKRGRGVGKSLLDYLIKKYEGIVDNITLEVRVDNKVAQSLYKKYHFIEKAYRVGYYNGIDGILMERSMKK